MKHFTFYHEFKNKRRGQSAGICVGAFGPRSSDGGEIVRDAVVGMFEQTNSQVCLSAVSQDYLRSKCKRVSEEVARKIHPRLFVWLDDVQDSIHD